MDQNELKTTFQSFMDCKSNSSNVAVKGIENFSTEAAKQVILVQDNCLKIIDKLGESNSQFLNLYLPAIRLTQERIKSEKVVFDMLLNFPTGDNATKLTSYNLAVSISRINENQAWDLVKTQVTKRDEATTKGAGTSSSGLSVPFLFGLIIIVALISYYNKNKEDISPEKVKEYFDHGNNKKNDEKLTEDSENQ